MQLNFVSLCHNMHSYIYHELVLITISKQFNEIWEIGFNQQHVTHIHNNILHNSTTELLSLHATHINNNQL
jgi:hypothetical protein